MTVQNKAIKLLSLILALLMIFGAMPLSVFAEGVSNEATDPISETEQNESPQTNDVMGPLLQSSGVEDSPSQNQVPGLPEYSGSENKPVGDIEISEDAFRMRLNQDGKSYTVVGYLSSSDTMHIPATYIGQNGEYPVTRIEEFAFQNKKNLKYVTIPDSIEYIGTEAFSGCDALVCNQYDNAQYLGSPANDYFYLLRAGGKDAEGKDINKTTMTSVEIHPDTKFIASYSFQNCMELTEIVVPESVVQIGFKAFRHVDSLKSITLPFVGETGTGTENSHFGYVFGAQTFGGNISYVPTGLTQVSILGGERITKNAFYGVDMVEEMTLPFVGEILTAVRNTHIGYMFGFDTYEGNANLPQSLKKVTVLGGAVGDNAFRGCVGISEVMLSDDVTSIGASAFYNCTALRKSTIGINVKSIGADAFYGCSWQLKAYVRLKNADAWWDIEFANAKAYPSALYMVDVQNVPITALVVQDNVTSIASDKFRNCKSLESITIPASVTNIGDYAFYECTNLKNVYISDLEAWNNISFANTYSDPTYYAGLHILDENGKEITHFVIPDGVTSIEANAFYNYAGMTTITIPDSVTSIGASAFENCTSLTTITIPDSVTSIGKDAFWGCTALISITIPESVTSIGINAFYNCTNLKDVYILDLEAWLNIDCPYSNSHPNYYGELHVLDGEGNEITDLIIPDSITDIRSYGLCNYKGLTSITIPESVTSIGYYAFSGCTGLTSITIPESVTSISYYAFSGCTGLTSITIPDSVTSINTGVFANCTGLISVILPDSVTDIAGDAFSGCSDRIYHVYDHARYLGNEKNPYMVLLYGSDNVSEIHPSTKIIAGQAFCDCSELVAITIPNSVTSIGHSAFKNCTSLTSIDVPDGVTNISNELFYNCISLTSVTLPDSIKTIGGFAFGYCSSLTSITIPADVEWIYFEAFAGCNLKDVYISDLEAWLNIQADDDCYYPNYDAELHILDEEGNDITDITIPEGVTHIRWAAFRGCKSMTSIVIPDTVTYIGYRAFYNCTGLTSITIPNSVTSIGDYTFYNCINLTSVFIPNSVYDMGYNVFLECQNAKIYCEATSEPSRWGSGWNPSGCRVVWGYSNTASASIDDDGSLDLLSSSNSSITLQTALSPRTVNIARAVTDTEISLVSAERTQGSEGLSYSLSADRTYYFVSKGSCTDNVIIIPEVYNDLPVKKISSRAFSGCNNLTSITIPNSVTSIGDYAFNYCANLTSITIPDSVLSIGSSAFWGCTGLTSITIPGSVSSIGSNAFYGCTNLKDVYIFDIEAWLNISGDYFGDLYRYGEHHVLDEDGNEITDITIPSSLTSIKSNAFYNFTYLTSVTIPDGVTSIGRSAFYGCTSLRDITIPDGVTSIGGFAFENCAGLTSITIPDSVTSIGGSSFYKCNNLKDVYISDIEAWLNISCGDSYSSPNYYGELHILDKEGNKVTNIIIPDGISSIRKTAFCNCRSLESITIPNGVTIIDTGAFSGCTSLTSITVPDSITSIGHEAFRGCSSLTSIEIPDSVTSIGQSAFHGCTSLTDVTIPDGVTSIDFYTFYGCTSLQNITIPDNVTTIGLWAFAECTSLASITIPASVTNIENGAFLNCTNLKVYIYDVEAWLNISFDNTEDRPNLYGELHVLDEEGNEVTDIIIPQSITSIANSAFSNSINITGITISDNVTSIGQSAFYGCTSLRDITIPDGVTSIGEYAFDNCASLTSITILGSITSIGRSVFSDCTSLRDVTIPDGVTSIGQSAFSGCTSLRDITIPDGVTSIGPEAFRGCSSLTSIEIPDSVTSIGHSAFHGCTSLTDVTIPDGVTSIDFYTFYGCTSLKSITIPENVTSIGYYAFFGCTGIEKINFNAISMRSGSFQYGDVGQNGNGITVTIGANVKKIPDYFFYDSPNIIAVAFADGSVCERIGMKAFCGCTGLTSITIPEKVTSIGDNAFSGCTGIEAIYFNATSMEDLSSNNQVFYYAGENGKGITVKIGDNVTKIPAYLFSPTYYSSSCSPQITTVIFSEKSVCESIGNYAFENCDKLTSITIPNSVTQIGTWAFSGCMGLISVTIPTSVTCIYRNTFHACSSLESITIPFVGESANGNQNMGYIFGGSVPASLKTVTVTGGHTIPERAFYGTNITSVFLPSSLHTIESEAFAGCSALKTVNIAGVHTIEERAFANCYNIESIFLPDNLSVIGSEAFYYCENIVSLFLPNTLRIIESKAFYGCSALTTINYDGEYNEWRFIQKATDWNSGTSATVIFKPNSGLLYEMGEGMDQFFVSEFDPLMLDESARDTATAIVIPKQFSGLPVTEILRQAFYNNKHISAITIPDTVTKIGSYAFTNCESLETIVIPDTITVMEKGIFSGCINLVDMTVPFIGYSETDTENAYLGYMFGAFEYKVNGSYVPVSLQTVTVTRDADIREGAFYDCGSITAINLMGNPRYIGDNAFAYCRKLTQFIIPDRVISVGRNIFLDCNSITVIYVGADLTSIEDEIYSEPLWGINKAVSSLSQYVVSEDNVEYGTDEYGVLYRKMMIPAAKDALVGNYAAEVERLTQKYSDYQKQYGAEHIYTLQAKDELESMKKMLESKNRLVGILNDDEGTKKPIYEIATAVVDVPANARLSNYDFPEHIVEISAYAFAYNNSLTSVDLEYIRMIGSHAFYEATGLNTVAFGNPETIESEFWDYVETISYSQYIGDYAFMGCTSLQKINLETDMIIGIGEQAFFDCENLKNVALGKNIQVIGLLAFGASVSGISHLEQIFVDPANAWFTSIQGVLYSYNEDDTLTLLWYPACLVALEMTTDEDGNIIGQEVQTLDGQKIYVKEYALPTTKDDQITAVSISAIETYAFQSARHLEHLVISGDTPLSVGDYAFAGSSLQSVEIGENVTTLGLKRGEGEYTVFADCLYLTAIGVSEDNPYYSSKNGVLFDKKQNKLIKYPASKTGDVYDVPETVSSIASMAFKNNPSLLAVRIPTYVSTIGLEAFYQCTNLAVIYFDHVYAPASIMENAFTTYYKPSTLIGYSEANYWDGEAANELGWSNYESVYTLQAMSAMPEVKPSQNNGAYAIVIVDEDGNRINGLIDENGKTNFIVTLTAPNGISETVYTGKDENGLGDGVAVFYDLYGSVSMGFSIQFDQPYSLRISDTTGTYYTFLSEEFYLDYDMRITYVTLVRKPCDISFNANGGSVDMGTIPYHIGETVQLPNDKAYRNGYTLLGWSLNPNDRENLFVEEFNVNKYKDHFVLYAIWEANINDLCFDANDSQYDAEFPSLGTMNTVLVRTDETIVLPVNGFAREGFAFLGWALSENGSVVYLDANAYTSGPESVTTLYAKWKGNENALVFLPDKAEGSMAEKVVVTGETIELPENAYTRKGYTFAGWKSEDGTMYNDGDEYKASAKPIQVLTAVWIPNLNTVNFDSNGGVGTMASIQEHTDDTVSLPQSAFRRSGYILIGWSDSKDGALICDSKGPYTVTAESSQTLYAVWVKTASIYGLNCGDADINTQTFTINQAEYGKIYQGVELIDPRKGYVDGNIRFVGATAEKIRISVICYYDKSYLTLDKSDCKLYQNGRAITGCTLLPSEERTNEEFSILYFEVPVDRFVAEVPVEARIGLTYGLLSESKVMTTAFLNIDVINFSINEDDVDLDAGELEVNLSQGGGIISTLLGNGSWSFSLGDHMSFNTVIDGNEIKLSLNAEYDKTSSKDYGKNYQAGYEANILSNYHKNTWRFETNQGNLPLIFIVDKDGTVHTYSMNIYFAKTSAPDGYCYYRCSINEELPGGKQVQKKLFYGVVNAKNGRESCKNKAYLIYGAYTAQAMSKQDITKGFEYSESVLFFSKSKENINEASSSHSFHASLYGDIAFQYEARKGLTPVSSYIKGELHYAFEHKQQFVVWVIPIYLQINVKLDGSIEISLAYDEWRSVSIEEAKMTIGAEVTAKVGVGCEIVSVGVYGTIGTVFVLDFAPEFGVEKWTVSGKLALYATFYTVTWKWPFVIQTTEEYAIFDKTYTIIDNTGKLKLKRSVDPNAFYMATMFLADNYEPADPSDCTEEARLFVYKDELYKIHYVTLLGSPEGEYDAYNYRKIGISKWNGTGWNEPVVLDDNGINDLDFTLYETNDGISVVFTQHPGKITEEIAEDSYEYASELVVKYVHLQDLSQAKTPDVVFDGGDYKYLTTTATVAAVPTVVWAENADNNMFGVSPYNYVQYENDPNASFHVFETTANSIWMSQYVNGEWTTPVCVKNGLSAITDLAISDDGTIVYIVDENGNLADINDRQMYYTDIFTNEIQSADVSEDGIVLDVEATKNGILGYYSGEKVSGLKYIDLANAENVNDLPADTSMLTDMHKILYNEHGENRAILYVQNKVWDENGESVDGATIYAIFCENGVWGAPVEITTSKIYPVAGRYITSFDAVWMEGEIMLSVEYVSNQLGNQEVVNAVTSSETDIYALSSDPAVQEAVVDYENQILILNVINDGALSTEIYAVINESGRTLVCSDLISGNSKLCEIDISGYGTSVRIQLFDARNDREIYSSEIDLNYSDLQPFVKQLLLGTTQNTLLVAVRNNGIAVGNGVLHIAVGNYSADALGENYIEILKNDSITREVENLGSGKIVYFEIPLSEQMEVDENTIVTVYVEPVGSLEKGNSEENNLLYTTLQSFTSIVEDDGTSYAPVVDAFEVTYDSKTPKDISFGYSCSMTNALQSVSVDGLLLEEGVQYSISDGTITLYRMYLDTIPAPASPDDSHKIVVEFSDGSEFEIQLNIVEYYTVTWLNGDGSILQEQSAVSKGAVPTCSLTPTKVSNTEGMVYSFIGWDSNGDNVVDKIGKVSGDVVYTPVWSVQNDMYTVTWILSDGEKTYEIEEIYPYSTIPQYKGKIIVPAEQEFLKWNKEMIAVTGDVTYEAVYEYSNRIEIAGTPVIVGDTRVGGILSLDLSGVAGKDFLSYQWYLDGVAIPDATYGEYTVQQSDVGRAITCEVTGIQLYTGKLVTQPVVGEIMTKMITITSHREYSVMMNHDTASQEYYTSEITQNYAVGTVLTLVAEDTDHFGYWKNGSNLIVSRDPSYTFTVTGAENIIAVYNTKARGKVTVIFESLYGQVMARTQVTEAGALNMVFPTPPPKYGNVCEGWEYTASELAALVGAALSTSDTTDDVIVVKPVYSVIPEVHTVTVIGGSGSGEYMTNKNLLVVANAPDEKRKFSHWEDEDGNILSYNAKYSFIVSRTTTVVAVYVDQDAIINPVGITQITEISYDVNSGIYTFISWSTIPEGCKIHKAGLILATDPSIGTDPERFTDETAFRVVGGTTDSTSYRYVYTAKTSKTCYVRAYLVYTDTAGNLVTIYGDIVTNK